MVTVTVFLCGRMRTRRSKGAHTQLTNFRLTDCRRMFTEGNAVLLTLVEGIIDDYLFYEASGRSLPFRYRFSGVSQKDTIQLGLCEQEMADGWNSLYESPSKKPFDSDRRKAAEVRTSFSQFECAAIL